MSIKNYFRKKRVLRKLYERELRRNKDRFTVTCVGKNKYTCFRDDDKLLYIWGFERNRVSFAEIEEGSKEWNTDRLVKYIDDVWGLQNSTRECRRSIEMLCYKNSHRILSRYLDKHHTIANKPVRML